jgi:selenocysteine lyase/cysteine desulfurase
MFTRRQFIDKLSLISAASLFGATQPAWSRNFAAAIEESGSTDPYALAEDEKFWTSVQEAYNKPPQFVNLNNGAISPSPRVVQEAMKTNYDFCNQAPSYYMSRVLNQGRESLRNKIADLAGCHSDEIALQRNATDALETIIFGIPLQAGDEVILTRQDYPSMIAAWKQREIREGIKLVWVNLKLPSEEESYLADSFTRLFTSRTKVVQLTHIINWIGQVLPVSRIAAEAKQRGILVMVDGAHSFAQLEFAIPDLQCDYFGTSLHKWLGAPIGTGFLYVKKDRISGLYPLYGSEDPTSNEIKKFEHLGTRPHFIEMAIEQAILFHEAVGGSRKFARLQYLKKYWMDRLMNVPGVSLHCSRSETFGSAIGLFSIKGFTNGHVEKYLFDNWKVHTVSIETEQISGIRVTPNVYTSIADLDQFINGVKTLCGVK